MKRATPGPQFVRCSFGAFTLPEEVYESLRASSEDGMVYMRHDEDILTISSERLNGGRRRLLHERYKIYRLQGAIQVAICRVGDAFQVMPVAWRTPRAEEEESS